MKPYINSYHLQMHRIPYGKGQNETEKRGKRPAVYLQHGLLCSSADCVMGIPQKSLGKTTILFYLIWLLDTDF